MTLSPAIVSAADDFTSIVPQPDDRSQIVVLEGVRAQDSAGAQLR